MANKVYSVGIIGCGKIFPRHQQAIFENKNFELTSVCDKDQSVLEYTTLEYSVKGFKCYKEMINSGLINFVVIATPNSQHFEQAMFAIQNKCDVLIEKPATLDPKQIGILKKESIEYGQNVYSVLQVRLNSCIQNLKYLIDNDIIGDIRGVGLIQRWQRPVSYFSDWRGEPLVGGGTLHECGIHYLDVICYLFGKPSVVSTKTYNVKHKKTEIEDTIYSILDFRTFGGNVEISISCEPHNLECSLDILTSKGYIKLGGKAMNIVEEIKFLDKKIEKRVTSIMNRNNVVGSPNSYGNYSGSCPNHPTLYKNIECFDLLETYNVLNLIDEIYSHADIKYYQNSIGN